jgi:uncharacterized FlgJ-related protein
MVLKNVEATGDVLSGGGVVTGNLEVLNKKKSRIKKNKRRLKGRGGLKRTMRTVMPAALHLATAVKELSRGGSKTQKRPRNLGKEGCDEISKMLKKNSS